MTAATPCSILPTGSDSGAVIKSILLGALILFIPQLSGAYETDQFSNRLQPIADSTDLLNEQVNRSIEKAIEHERPVRIGVNWGSLDQSLLTKTFSDLPVHDFCQLCIVAYHGMHIEW